MTADPATIESPWVRARVYRMAALLHDPEFRLPSGRWVRPFATAPWPDTPDPELPGHLRRLGGEFFCLPFGGGGAAHSPSPGWESLAAGSVDVPMHGPAANQDWEFIDQTAQSVTLSLDLPEAFAVRRLERRITLAEDSARVAIEVRIEARRAGMVPAAFHPILRLPAAPGGLAISADFTRGFTYPAVIEPGRMACEPGLQFDTLARAPRRGGGRIDLSRLPLGPPTEDVVLMAGMRGPVRAIFRDQQFALELDWSRDRLPHCMMWVHDRGADNSPWLGRYRGLGIEPLAAAFDGPWNLSVGANPLSDLGYPTVLAIRQGQPVTLNCYLAVTAS